MEHNVCINWATSPEDALEQAKELQCKAIIEDDDLVDIGSPEHYNGDNIVICYGIDKGLLNNLGWWTL